MIKGASSARRKGTWTRTPVTVNFGGAMPWYCAGRAEFLRLGRVQPDYLEVFHHPDGRLTWRGYRD